VKTEVKEISPVMRELTITIEADEMQEEYRKELNKFKNYVQIPGFRKGKAPIAMVERIYGEYAKEEFLSKKMETYYQEALKTIDVHPVSEASTDKIEWEKGKELVAVFTFEIMPEIVVSNYQNLEIPYEERPFSKEMIDIQLNEIQKQLATIIQPEQLEIEDEVNFTARILDENGNAADEKNIETLFVKGEFTDEFYDNLEHAKVGEEIKTILYETGDMEEERRKQAVEEFGEDCFGKEYIVKINSINRHAVPEINDELAKDMEFDSLEELKQHIEKEIMEKLKKENEDTMRGAIIDKLLKENPFELPPSMVLRYAETMAKPYAKAYKTTVEELIPIYKNIAEYNMKSYYLLEELKKLEPVEITDEDRENLIAEAAANLNMEVDKYKELYKKQIESEEFEAPIIEKKLFALIKSTATFVPYPKEPVQSQIEEADTNEEESTN
jgi:trigger factor